MYEYVDVIAKGGKAAEDLRTRWRAARKKYREQFPDRVREQRHRKRKPFHARLCLKARKRARKLGVPGTITAKHLHWPEYCPVLGTRLEYGLAGMRDLLDRSSIPSLDRVVPSLGYVPGNVFVISQRANELKSNATADQLETLAKYARDPLSVCLP